MPFPSRRCSRGCHSLFVRMPCVSLGPQGRLRRLRGVDKPGLTPISAVFPLPRLRRIREMPRASLRTKDVLGVRGMSCSWLEVCGRLSKNCTDRIEGGTVAYEMILLCQSTLLDGSMVKSTIWIGFCGSWSRATRACHLRSLAEGLDFTSGSGGTSASDAGQRNDSRLSRAH